MFRSFAAKLSHWWWRASLWTADHKQVLVLGLVVGLFLVPHIALADNWFSDWMTEGLLPKVFGLIISIVSFVVQLLGQLFIYLVDIFLGFAKYNGFGDALPVRVGWVIVRDVCNMFFIVILLISAFGTIIPWDTSLRYNTVLPKLLLMAVLINFSRTIIQLLIDFSQVIMLTFVNAFQSVGAGNFVEAFKIHELLAARSARTEIGQEAFTQGADSGNFELASKIFVSYLLALILIVIANGVMVIMIAYILFRIIGLWMALIFAPAAFFVTAVPGRLQKSLTAFTGKYWGRLGAMLTGGPVVAFFLYLTFAILQDPSATCAPAAGAAASGSGNQAPSPADCGVAGKLQLYNSANLENNSDLQPFLTRVGSSDSVASFIVATAMMLLALEAAVETAGQVDSSLGKFAGTVGGASKALAMGAATLAATSPWIAAKMGYGIADRRIDMTGWLSKQGMRTVGRIPILGKYVRKPLAAGMMMRKREAAAEADEAKKMTAGMTADQMRMVRSTYSTLSKSWLPYANLGEQKAAQAISMEVASEPMWKEERKRISDEEEKRLDISYNKSKGLKEGMKGYVEFEEIERQAAIHTDQALAQLMQQDLKIADEIAKKNPSDVGFRQKLKELRNTNPLLQADDKKMDEKIHQGTTNAQKASIWSSQAKSHGRVLTEVLKHSGVITVDASGNVKNEIDDGALSTLLERHRGNTELVDNLKFYAESIRNSSGDVTKKDLDESVVMKDWNGERSLYSSPKVGMDLAGRLGARIHPKLGEWLGTPHLFRPSWSDTFLSGSHMMEGVREVAPELAGTGTEMLFGPAKAAMASFKAGGNIDPDQVRAYLSNPTSSLIHLLAVGKGDAARTQEIMAAITKVLEEDMSKGRTHAVAGEGSQFNAALRAVSMVMDNMENQGVSGGAQEMILKALVDGGLGTILSSKVNFTQLSPEKREQFTNVLRIAQSRIAGYAAAGQAAPDFLENLTKQIRDAFTEPTGNKEKVAAPIRNVMENQRPAAGSK